jgi:SAM-dependent methyltransferase
VPATPRSARQRSIRLFDRVAPVYDRVGPAFFQAFAHLLVERAAIPPGHRVLDVGTGRGALLRAVADDATARSVGVDLSAGMLAWGALDLRAAGARASLARMDGARLAFGDETFDVVVCGFTLDLVSDPEGLLAEARRVLRPGGRLAVSTWAADCPYFDWLAEALDGGPSGRRVRREVPPAASAEGLRRLLGRAGLTAVDIGTVDRRFVYTDAGPPDRMMPPRFIAPARSSAACGGAISDQTFASRTRRAINWAYCAPRKAVTASSSRQMPRNFPVRYWARDMGREMTM